MVERVPAQPTTSDEVTITTSKENYKTREKIEVTIHLTDEEGKPVVGDLSMSVTDIKQVSPIRTARGIAESYPIKVIPPINSNAGRKPFVVEHGITIKGRF